MRKTFTALRMLLLVASIGFVGLCTATAFTFLSSWVTSSIHGTAYLDCNRNGIKENTEIGFGNMRVTLAGRSSVGDTVTLTTTTNVSGLYQFNGLVAGTYTIQFGFPTGTSALSYAPLNTGSQVDASGRTAPLSINGTSDVNDVNAGIIDQTPPKIQFTNPNIAAYISGDTVVVACDNLPIMDASWVTVTDNSGRVLATTFVDVDSITGTCSRDGYLKILKCVWAASDVCGNNSAAAIYVKIIDNKAPTLVNVPVNITVKTAKGEVIPTPATVTATDNCINTGVSVIFSETEINNQCGKNIIRTWTAVDDCGNQSSGVQTITVISVAACLNAASDTLYIGLPGGGGIQTCLDLGGTGRLIQSIQHCGTGSQLLSVSAINGSCINVTTIQSFSQSATDTFCIQNCLSGGDCHTMVLIFNSVARLPPCHVISSRNLATMTTANCGDLGCFCLADSVDINDLRNNYTISDNNIAYSSGYTGCNFDTIYSYTYFTVPDMGSRGPYRLDYWQINGIDRSIASFNTIEQLVDSMNVWDPLGNWKIDSVVFAISGGSTRNTYGQMKITRLSNRAFGFLELNVGIISNGIQMCATTGPHTIIFLNNASGCSDTIKVQVACLDSTAGFKPHAVDDIATTSKNHPITINVLANDTVYSNLTRPLSIIGSPRRGTASLSSNQIVYTPSLNFCGGKDTLKYEICNVNGCDTADVFITINCDTSTVVIRLAAVDDRISTMKNTIIRFRPLNNDTIVGGLLALGVVTAPRHGAIGFSGLDSLIYTPNRDYCGLDTMTYRICNLGFTCDTATIFITVTCDLISLLKPNAIDDVATTKKNQPLTISVLTNDIPNGTLTASVSIVNQPKRGSGIAFNNQIIYTPNLDICGVKDTLSYEICNAQGCDTATIFITVTCDNLSLLLPVAVNDLDSMLVNTTKIINVLANDILNDTIIGPLSITAQPTFGTVIANADGTLAYKPFAGYCGGNDVFSYKICNTIGCDSATVTVKVICDSTVLNKLPVAFPDVMMTTKNKPLRIIILANDNLNGRLDSIKIISSPLLGTAILGSDYVITYIPDSCGFTDYLIYRICNQNGCDTALVTIKVSCDPVILPKPVAVDDTLQAVKNRSVLINVLANDTLFSASLDTIYIFKNPRRGGILVEGTQIRYLPQTDSCAYRDTFSYIICTVNGCDTADVFVNIFCSEDSILKPVAVFDTARTKTDQLITINVTLNDTLHGADTFRITQNPQNGIAVFDAQWRIVYTPRRAFCGNDTLIYEICNRNGCDTALVTIKVDCLPPVALDDSIKTRYNLNVTIPIVLNDTLNAADSIAVLREPTKGTVTILIDKTAIYTPNLNFCGKDTFQYVVCNRFGCDSAWVRVDVSCGDSLLIFNAISPNGDGKNDGFYLRGIENYPDNEVLIFNRWGNEVYRKKGYRNDEAWQGTWNNKAVPEGTYFYQIYLNDANLQKYTGYLQIMK